MDLTSDSPYWFLKNGLICTYPFPARDINCDVAVVGAGITGAMVAERLSKDGHSVVVLDGRDVCCGSTSASTALLQYEIDVPLVEMATMIGNENAVNAWKLSYQSLDDMEDLVLRIGTTVVSVVSKVFKLHILARRRSCSRTSIEPENPLVWTATTTNPTSCTSCSALKARLL